MLARPGGEVRAGILRVEQTMNPHLKHSGGPRVLRSLYSSSVVRGPLGDDHLIPEDNTSISGKRMDESVNRHLLDLTPLTSTSAVFCQYHMFSTMLEA